jgi:U4/U6.U5 tri-snRNP-associated protein 1
LFLFIFTVAEERAAEVAKETTAQFETDIGGGGLTFDDTSEFVRAISYNPAPPKQHAPAQPIVVQINTAAQRDDHMDEGDEAMSEPETGEVDPMEDDQEDESAVLLALENAIGRDSDEVKPDLDVSIGQDLTNRCGVTLRFSDDRSAPLRN